jgi:hypothetical protein
MARIATAPSFIPLAAAKSTGPRPALGSSSHYADPLSASLRSRLAAAATSSSTRLRSPPPPAPVALWVSLLAIYVGVDIPVTPADVWPPLNLGQSSPAPAAPVYGYYVSLLSRSTLCVDGVPAVASGCASLFTGGMSEPLLTVNTGPYTHTTLRQSRRYSQLYQMCQPQAGHCWERPQSSRGCHRPALLASNPRALRVHTAAYQR